jgi:hypothetical protein
MQDQGEVRELVQFQKGDLNSLSPTIPQSATAQGFNGECGVKVHLVANSTPGKLSECPWGICAKKVIRVAPSREVDGPSVEVCA